MKLAAKFALAFVASGAFSIVVYSSVAASREIDDVEEAVAEDLASVGRTLRASALSVWERDGEGRARDLVTVHDRDEAIDVRWTWLDVGDGDPLAPRGGAAVVPALLRGEQPTWVDVGADKRRLLYAYVPVLRPDARPAAIEVSRPLVKKSQVFWAEAREQLLLSTLVAAFAIALAVGLTSWIISRPLARVAEQARRIGGGDLSRELPVRGSDEVAALIRELNAMCRSLRDARELAAEETRQRLAALEQLRHADRLRTVGTLASGLAHEVGTPLNVIAMRAKMLATGELTSDEAPESARIIHAQAERVTKIVRQLLDFARRRAPDRADTDLVDLAERTKLLLEALGKRSGVEMKVTASGAVRAHVDAAQIEHALTNLVVNAIHAMPTGGELSIAVRAELAAPEGSASRPCAVLEVTDTGVGIAPDDLGRIEEPFFTTKDVGEGTGLGLSVTHGIVEDHGGWLRASSVVGEGTRVAIYLPVAPPA